MVTVSHLEDLATLRDGGRRMWKALLSRDPDLGDQLNPMRILALQVCQVVDRCDRLDELVRKEGPVADNGKAQPASHPAWVEARRNDRQLVQLLNALRLPDPRTGKRPQRRPPRGVYRPRG